jgi:hypothetical protein
VDVGVARAKLNEVVGDALPDKVVASVDVTGFARDGGSKGESDGRDVVSVERGRSGLGEADSGKVVAKAEKEFASGGEAIVLGRTRVESYLVLGAGVREEGGVGGADGEVSSSGREAVGSVGKGNVDVAAEEGAFGGVVGGREVGEGLQVPKGAYKFD